MYEINDITCHNVMSVTSKRFDLIDTLNTMKVKRSMTYEIYEISAVGALLALDSARRSMFIFLWFSPRYSMGIAFNKEDK